MPVLSFMLKSFSFPGVSVGQGCVLLLAPSCNGKDPCCSHPYQSQPLCSGSLSSFQLEQEYWYMCLRWQDNIPGFCCAGARPLSHPCAQAPPQPLQPCTPHFSLSANSSFNCYSPQELHSLLDGPSSLLSRFLPSLSRIITFEGHLKTFFIILLGQCWSFPVYPDFAGACLDVVTLISFQPLTSLVKNTCPVPIFLLLCSCPSQFCSRVGLVTFQRIQSNLSCTSSPPGAGTLLGQNSWEEQRNVL